MKYSLKLLIVLLCINSIEAQEFIEVDTLLPFPKVASTSLIYVDIDGDNDEDLVLSGKGSPGIYTKLFLNEGGGNFIENPEVPFEQVFDGDIATSDIDGDGDKDLLICGWNESFKVRTSLYINQGDGTFLENTDNSLEDISNGEVAFCDVDGASGSKF